MWKEIKVLVQQEIQLELRKKYVLNGLLLYVVSAVLICYFSFSLRKVQLNIPTWNALLWLILLFTAVSAIAKSFMQERAGRWLYYYTVCSAQSMILAKMIYNVLLMLLLTVIGWGVYGIMLGNPVEDVQLFVVGLLLGAVGFSVALTMISGIAAKANNNAVLMSILSFPVILPMLLMLMRISKNAVDGLDRASSLDELLTLLALNAIMIAVSWLLFPFLWRS